MREIKLPDNHIARFPDDFSDEMINDALNEHFDSQQNNEPEQQQAVAPQSKSDLIASLLPKPRLPIGMDIMSGLMSLAGRNKGEKDLIRNLPHIATGQEASLPQKFAQGIGEYAPMEMTGLGSVTGIPGTLARIAGNASYGAAVSPDERASGAGLGALLGGAGEVVPGAIKAAEGYAEKIRPIKYVKDKISEMRDLYGAAKKEQKQSYKDTFDLYGDQYVTPNPEEFLGFDKSDMSLKAEKAYESFVNEPIAENLHKLQSQFYQDANYGNRFKNSSDEGAVRIRDKAEINRPLLIEKMKELLKTKPEALESYNKGTNLTRDVIKPFEATKATRELVKGKVKAMAPNKFGKVIETALKSNTEFPEGHYLRQLHPELEHKLELGRLMKTTIPEMVRRWTPRFAETMQSPLVEALLNATRMPGNIAKMGILGKTQE